MPYSIALRGKRFKKFYCACCGERLAREKIRRTVTPQDEDYGEHCFRGHSTGKGQISFSYHHTPQQNIKVSDTRYACPACHKRIPFKEQMIRAGIQKKLKKRRLTPTEILSYHEEFARKYRNRSKAKGLLFDLAVLAICGVLYVAISIPLILLALITAWLLIPNTVRLIRHRNDPVTESRDDKFHRLHAKAYGNEAELQTAALCHCFHCVKSFSPAEIFEWAEDGKTALCPCCRNMTVIPEDESDPIDGSRLADINKYWF